MDDKTGDVLHVVEKRLTDNEASFDYAVYAQADVPKLEPSRVVLEPVRAWAGDIVFDHVRGARELEAAPLCEPPYLIVGYEMDHDWTNDSKAFVQPHRDLAVALAVAQRIVASERGQVSWNREITAVYLIRVREVWTPPG